MSRRARRLERTLHVVDADTLTAGPTEYQCQADEAARRYRAAASLLDHDQVVVGSDVRSSAVTCLHWRAASRPVVTSRVHLLPVPGACAHEGCLLPVGRSEMGLAA